jgi:hypothetical protein
LESFDVISMEPQGWQMSAKVILKARLLLEGRDKAGWKSGARKFAA